MNEPLSLGPFVDIGNNRFVFRKRAIAGQTYQLFCPCGETILMTFPSPGNIQVKCKNCQRLYAAAVREAPKENVTEKPEKPQKPYGNDTVTTNPTEPVVSRTKAGAVLVYGSLLHRKKNALYYGSNVIGRSDVEVPSDIPIDDHFVSRRSVEIKVKRVPDGSGNIFRLRVLKTMNPVYVNNRQIQINEQVYLKYNDKLKIGNTILTLKKN